MQTHSWKKNLIIMARQSWNVYQIMWMYYKILPNENEILQKKLKCPNRLCS